MQAKPRNGQRRDSSDIAQNLVESQDQHLNLRQRLSSKFKYYDEERAKWQTITNLVDPKCERDRILIRCNHARQVLSLPYPFKLGNVCYLWGLIAGSTSSWAMLNKDGISIDAIQEEVIQEITSELGIHVQITPVRRSRRKRGVNRSPSQYRKIQVRFPSVLKRFLHCLGWRPRRLTLPQWLNDEQQMVWIEGYFNSSKIHCHILRREETRIQPTITIYATNNNPRLLQDISKVLERLSINCSTFQFKNGNNSKQLACRIQGSSNVLKLLQHFPSRRPKLRALSALLQECQRQRALRLSLKKLALSEFHLTIYGTILSQPAQELEYTLLERTFASSSNEIRQVLYDLDEYGLINYYKKENNKEFFVQSSQYLHVVQHLLKVEELKLCRHLKFTDSNALSFHCSDCDCIVGYAEAMGDGSFGCPQCNSKELQPLEMSRFLYVKRLAHLTGQQNLVGGTS